MEVLMYSLWPKFSGGPLEDEQGNLFATSDYILCGSRALSSLINIHGHCYGHDRYLPLSIKARLEAAKNSDYDFLVHPESNLQAIRDRYERADFIPISKELFDWLTNEFALDTGCYASKGVWYYKQFLMTLKLSHLTFKGTKKALQDIHLFSMLRIQVVEEAYYKLFDYWQSEAEVQPWRANFSMTVEDFFNDAVSRLELHDDLHKRFSFEDQPAFRLLQEPDQLTVDVSYDKWKLLTEQQQLNVIIEETLVLTYERIILSPNPKTREIPYQAAYLMFLQAMLLRLTPRWMVPFMANNYLFFAENIPKFNLEVYNHYKKDL